MNHISKRQFLGIVLAGIIIMLGNNTYAGGIGGAIPDEEDLAQERSLGESPEVSPSVSPLGTPQIAQGEEDDNLQQETILGLTTSTWLWLILLVLLALLILWLLTRGKGSETPPQS